MDDQDTNQAANNSAGEQAAATQPGSVAGGDPTRANPTANPTENAPAMSAPARGIGVTERAAIEIKRVIEEEGLPEDTCLRVGAKGGGCSGFTYVLDFDHKGKTEFDLEYESHGIKVLVDKKSEFFMSGTVIDFNNGLLNRGFVFTNPKATSSCGCGTSFSA